MAVTDIMHSDWFYTSQCFIFLETFLQCSRYNRKQPLIFRKSIMLLRILLHLFFKKIRNINSTDWIFCFWSINHISFPDPVISLIDMQKITTHIKVRKIQCQKLSFPDSCPEQNFKYQIILTLWLNPGDKAVIFCFRPKFQLISIRFPHLFYFLTWIFLQIVNFLCMIKQCI